MCMCPPSRTSDTMPLSRRPCYRLWQSHALCPLNVRCMLVYFISFFLFADSLSLTCTFSSRSFTTRGLCRVPPCNGLSCAVSPSSNLLSLLPHMSRHLHHTSSHLPHVSHCCLALSHVSLSCSALVTPLRYSYPFVVAPMHGEYV